MTKNVCWQCIGEDLVSAEIKAEQPRRTCSYCGSRRAAIRVEGLARRVDPVFQNIVGEAEAGFVMRDGNPDWAPDGDLPSNIMTEILEADTDEIGRDLVSVLADRYRVEVNDGGFDFYDDTSDTYAILDAEDDWFGRGWQSFCDELKHQRRFFLDQSAHVLDEIFGPILREDGRQEARSGRSGQTRAKPISFAPGPPTIALSRKRSIDNAAASLVRRRPGSRAQGA